MSEASTTETAVQRCLVYCRLRPNKRNEYPPSEDHYPLLALSKNNVSVDKEKLYVFDGTFGPDCKQRDIFEGVGLPCVNHAINGFCSAIMCYGQTGTGKSFTMCNPTPGLEGIIPRSAHYLFEAITKASEEKNLDFVVEAQFVQIYRDHLGDLMSESGNSRVEIHYDGPGGVTLPGCSSHVLTSPDEFMHLFDSGYKNRVTVATKMNPESSRGHAALVVWVSSKSKDESQIEQRKGKITFIDLAGYERFSKTGISTADPIRKDEAKTINASLLALGHVVTSLSNHDKHVPWRNSKLTRLLQDSIGGKSRTTIVLTVGPSSEHLFETTNTLQFGQRAMAVRVQSKQKVIVDWQKHALKLQALLEEKQTRIEELQQQLAGMAAAESELILRQQKDIDSLREKHAEEVSRIQEEGGDYDRLQTLRHQQAVEAELLFTQQAEERQYQEQALEEEEERELDRVRHGGEGPLPSIEVEGEPAAASDAAAAAADAAAAASEKDQKAPTAPTTGMEETVNFADTYSPSSRLGANASKDEVITELKKQVRLYRMKLLVPEKYRSSSEILEHEAIAAQDTATRHLQQQLQQQQQQGNTAGSLSPSERDGRSANASFAFDQVQGNMVTVAEFEAMRRTLEAEIDNRDALLAEQLDIRRFANFAGSEPAKKSTGDDKEKPGGGGGDDEAIENMEARVASYIASLQRRISDLSERLEKQKQAERSSRAVSPRNDAPHPPPPPPTQTGGAAPASGEEATVSEPPSSLATTAATTAAAAPHGATSTGEESEVMNAVKKEPHQEQHDARLAQMEQLLAKWNESFCSVIFESKRAVSSACAELNENLQADWVSLSTAYSTENQYLSTELETAKVEMSMALEGQNESLMDAIENAREEAAAKFKIEKLSWEEDVEDRVNSAMQEGANREKRAAQDQMLMLEGEIAKLQNQLAESQQEASALQDELSLADAVAKQHKQQHDGGDNNDDDHGRDRGESPPPRSSPSTTTSIKPPPTLTAPVTGAQQSQLSKTFDDSIDLDSVLMPVLKRKTQLLDDITDALSTTGLNVTPGGGGAAGGGVEITLDHIPEIPLRSGRIGDQTFTDSLDPHASLSGFVAAIQAQRQQQASYTIAAPGTGRIDPDDLNQTLNGNLVDPSQHQQPQPAQPAGIPKLSLGALNKVGYAGFGGNQTQQQQNQNQQQQQQQIPLTAHSTVTSIGGAGAGIGLATARSLPASLPATIMKIVKRMRESASESESKWMKCIAALAKISKSVNALTDPAAASHKSLGASTSGGGGGGNTARIAAEIMNYVNAALVPILDNNNNNNNPKSSRAGAGGAAASARQRPRGMSEAEQARRALGDTLVQSVVAGETQVAEQQALQSLVLNQQDQLKRCDEDVVSIAVELARSKLLNRFERQIMEALGDDETGTGDADADAKKMIEDFDNVVYDQKNEARIADFPGNSELRYYRLKAAMLEQKHRSALGQIAKLQSSAAGTSQVAGHGGIVSTARSATQNTSQLARLAVEQEQQREVNTASASIVTDMEMITSCREAELRVMTARLETVERELSIWKRGGAGGKNAAGAPGVGKAQQVPGGAASHPPHSSSSSSSGGVASSAETVFYHILRNLRKENSILHSVIRERGLQLRKFGMTLKRHQLLPPRFDVAGLAGDVHSELRLAFAERDEEIFLKEQALNMRSTQVIVLEESLSALIDQLQNANIVPCRPGSKFAAELQRAKTEISEKLKGKKHVREELKSKIERIKTELERVEQKLAAERSDGQQQEISTSRFKPTDPQHQDSKATSDQLLVLRLQKDHLSHTKNISEVQLGALESELSILQQSLLSASSTEAIEAGIGTQDAEENVSVMTRLFRKLGGGK